MYLAPDKHLLLPQLREKINNFNHFMEKIESVKNRQVIALFGIFKNSFFKFIVTW